MELNNKINAQGLISKVYGKMGVGLVVTALTSLLTYILAGDLLIKFAESSWYFLFLLIFLVTSITVITRMGSAAFKGNLTQIRNSYYTITFMFGLLLSVLLIQYDYVTLLTTLASTSMMFIVLGFIGAKTKKDLSPMGSFLSAALIGLLVVMVIGLFIPSIGGSLVISGIAILLFSAFIVYDTQKIIKVKQMELSERDEDVMVYMLALNLYLDFINLFQHLLRFIGISSND